MGRVTDQLTDEQLRSLSVGTSGPLADMVVVPRSIATRMAVELLELRPQIAELTAVAKQLRQAVDECTGLGPDGSHAGRIASLDRQVESLRQQLGSAQGRAGAQWAAAIERKAQVEARDRRIKELEADLDRMTRVANRTDDYWNAILQAVGIDPDDYHHTGDPADDEPVLELLRQLGHVPKGLESEKSGVWVVAVYGDMGQFSSVIPCLTELDALRELNTNWRDWGSGARVVFVPFGTDVQEVCK